MSSGNHALSRLPSFESGQQATRAERFNRARLMTPPFARTVTFMEKKLTKRSEIDAEMRNIIEEARVILPGVQALFGFQTIAVFNDRFEELETYAKICHVLGLAMVILTVAMVMTPAVYYRACGGIATGPMTRVSARMIRGALGPLAAGLALDMFTVIYVVTSRLIISVVAAVGTFGLLAVLWLAVPMAGRKYCRGDESPY